MLGGERRIGAVEREQLRVAAGLDEAAVVQNANEMAALNGGEAMRDDDRRSALARLFERRLHKLKRRV